MASKPLQIKCKNPCDIEFWADEGSELSSQGFEEKETKGSHKIYHFDNSKNFKLNLNKSKTGKLKYRIISTGEDQSESEYEISNSNVNSSHFSRRRSEADIKYEDEPAGPAHNSCKALLNYKNREGFSCYYDSLFFALFAFPSNFIAAHLFTKKDSVNQDSFNRIFTYLHKVSLFEKDNDFCLALPDELLINPSSRNAQQDASELLSKIFETLQITTLVEEQTENSQKKQSNASIQSIFSSDVVPIITLGKNTHFSVDGTTIILTTTENNFYSIPKHLNSKSDEIKAERNRKYEIYQQSITAKRSPEERAQKSRDLDAYTALILPEEERKNFTYHSIIITKKYNLQHQQFIVIKNGGKENKDIGQITLIVSSANQSLNLNQIVCRSGDEGGFGGHYVCYFRCHDKWYLYNDIGSTNIKFIGSKLNFEQGYKWTLLFYNEVNPQKPE